MDHGGEVRSLWLLLNHSESALKLMQSNNCTTLEILDPQLSLPYFLLLSHTQLVIKMRPWQSSPLVILAFVASHLFTCFFPT